VYALEVLGVTYNGSGKLVFTGLERIGNDDEYVVTALRDTAGPTITVEEDEPGTEPGDEPGTEPGTGTGGTDDPGTGGNDEPGTGGGTDPGGSGDEPGTPVSVVATVQLPEGSVTINPETPNTANVTVPESSIEAAISDALEQIAAAGGNAVAGVEISVGDIAMQGVNAVIFQIPVSGLEKVAASAVETMSVVTAIGTVTLDGKAVDALIAEAGGAENAGIAVERKDTLADGDLTEAQKAALAGDPNVREVYDVSVVIGGDKRDFVTEGELTIGLPYALREGESGAGVWVCHIADDGTADRMSNGRKYESGKAFFKTSHLSIYAVTYEATGADEAEEGDAPYNGGGGCDAGTGAAALAAIGAAAVLAIKRRRG
jgi:hypothetical protein